MAKIIPSLISDFSSSPTFRSDPHAPSWFASFLFLVIMIQQICCLLPYNSSQLFCRCLFIWGRCVWDSCSSVALCRISTTPFWWRKSPICRIEGWASSYCGRTSVRECHRRGLDLWHLSFFFFLIEIKFLWFKCEMGMSEWLQILFFFCWMRLEIFLILLKNLKLLKL